MQATALNVLFEGFLLSREADGASKGTLDAYRFMFKHLCENLPTSAIRDPSTITTEDIQRWSVSMASYANATRGQRIAKAKAFFNWLVKEGFLEENPVQLKRPKNNWRPDPLTEDQIFMFLEAAKKAGARDYAICCMFLDSGARSSELANLRPEDVTLKTGRSRCGKARAAGRAPPSLARKPKMPCGAGCSTGRKTVSGYSAPTRAGR